MSLRVPLFCDWMCLGGLKCSCALSESLGLRSKVMKKIEELKMAPANNGTPDEYLCPITREVMKDPVIAAGECLRDVYLLDWRFCFELKHFLLVFPPQTATPMNGRPSRAGSTRRAAPALWPTCPCRPPFWHPTVRSKWPFYDGPLVSDFRYNEPRREFSLALEHHGAYLRSDWL